MNIKTLVKGTEAVFSHCCQGVCYYNIEAPDGKYQLGIDSNADEWKNTNLLARFKSITLMRWIRKSIDDGTLIKIG